MSRLSSLELNGYKTFANQTIFEFPANVTSIVGPNGSGKSNIADSIRWVLGEQSFSLLRAKRTEDMIFAGSDQRSRAGMASVSIAFNNAENWLPIDYAEVVLTRRAYRDGQNEYLINNQRVRLKDFQELLSQTGLSDRTYTIIGQGLVDLALSIKPDERRKLFEEAAGIGLYRIRKEETFRRLEATRRNLDRVLDIITELRPRLRSLERQANRVSEFKQIQLSLREALTEWYGYYWFTAQKEIEQAQKDYKQAEKFLDQNRKEISNCQEELERIRITRNTLVTQLSEMRNKSQNIRNSFQEANKNAAILEERKKSIEIFIDQLRVDISETQNVITSKTEKLVDATVEFEKLKAINQTAVSDFQHEKDKWETFIKEKQFFDDELAALRQQIVHKETLIIKNNANHSELIDRISDFESQVKQDNLKINEYNLKREKTIEQKNGLIVEQEKNQKQLNELIKVESDHKSKLDDLQQSIRVLEKERTVIQSENARLKVRLEALIQSGQTLAGFSNGAKNLVRATDNKASKYKVSILLNNLKVQQKFELAITAALGEAIDLLVIDTKTIDHTILSEIEAVAKERVAVFSKDVRFDNDEDLSIDRTKIIGFAIEFVSAPIEYLQILNSILKDVIVVENKTDALHLIKEGIVFKKIVTLEGELFLNNGVIYLGKGLAETKVSISRQKEELGKIISNNTQSEEVLIREIKDIRKKSDIVSQQKEANENSIADLVRNMKEIDRQISQLDLEEDGVSAQITWLTNQIETAKRKILDTQAIISKIQADNEMLHLGVERMNQEEKILRLKISDYPINDLRSQLYEYETKLAISNEAYKHAKELLDFLQINLQEDLQKQEEYHIRLEENEAALKELINNHNILKADIENFSNQIEALDQENLIPTELSLKSIENDLEEKSREEKELQRINGVRERQFSQVQVELSRRLERLENLKEKIYDDFGLVVIEKSEQISTPDGLSPLPFTENIIETLTINPELREGVSSEINQLKSQLRRIGSINPLAQDEYNELNDRFNYLQSQVSDLEKASEDLQKIIKELDEIIERDFITTFKLVNTEFSKMFARLFNGGSAHLIISDENDPIESGIDIEAKLPGRREQGLVLLSGGERSLTAVALVFALLKVSPTPFCVLDEVDAMLDESNVGLFVNLLKELSEKTQFILITHNRNTVQVADVIYGVTMGRDSTSQVISLKLDEVSDKYVD